MASLITSVISKQRDFKEKIDNNKKNFFVEVELYDLIFMHFIK